MIAWPHALTDWNYMLPQVVECYCEMARAIARFTPLIIVTPEPDEVRRLLADVPPERISFLKADTNDTWTRDYGPISTVGCNGEVIVNDFKFNAWGLNSPPTSITSSHAGCTMPDCSEAHTATVWALCSKAAQLKATAMV